MNTPKPGDGALPRGSGRTIRALLAGAVGLLFVGLFLGEVNLARVGAMLHSLRPAWILLALAVFAVDFLLRALRFWMMLRFATRRPLALRPAVGPFIASFGISDILPFRAGDGFRIYWFNRCFAIPVGQLIGAMIVERLLDLVSIVALGAGLVAGSRRALPSAFSSEGQVLLILGLIVSGTVLFAPRRVAGLLERVLRHSKSGAVRPVLELARSAAEAITSIGSLRRVAGLLVSSIALWLIEFLVFLCAWLSLGGAVGDWPKSGLAFASATLGTLVPALPGHFGTFEYFGMNAFTMAGVDPTRAAAVIFTAHFLLWAPTALFAVWWLSLSAVRSPPVLSRQ